MELGSRRRLASLLALSSAMLACSAMVTGSQRGGNASCGELQRTASNDALHLIGVSQVGATQGCIAREGGTVWCRGDNSSGQLGTGTLEPRGSARSLSVADLHDIVELVSNDTTLCARTRSGEVWCWGDNRRGMIGNGHEGDVVCQSSTTTPCQPRPFRVALDGSATRVIETDRSVCALLQNAQVWCWGEVRGLDSSLGGHVAQPARLSDVSDAVDLFAAGQSIAIVHENGRITSPEPLANIQIPIGSIVRASNLGGERYCYLTPERNVFCWGANDWSVAGNGVSSSVSLTMPVDTGLRCIVDVSVSPFHACALASDGGVYCWGSNSGGESGVGRSSSEECFFQGRSRPCVRRPTRVRGLGHVISIHASPLLSCALQEDFSIWCWGNLNGSDTHVPTQVVW